MYQLFLEESYDFSLYGMISSLKDYQIAYYLGKFFDVEFKAQVDIKVLYKRNVFGDYVNLTAVSNCSDYRIIRNKAVNPLKKPKYIVPEFVEYDFILQVGGEIHEWNADLIVEELKGVKNLNMVKEIDLEQLEFKENLIY